MLQNHRRTLATFRNYQFPNLSLQANKINRPNRVAENETNPALRWAARKERSLIMLSHWTSQVWIFLALQRTPASLLDYQSPKLSVRASYMYQLNRVAGEHQTHWNGCCKPIGNQQKWGETLLLWRPNARPASTGCSSQELFCTPEDTHYGTGIDIKPQRTDSLTG